MNRWTAVARLPEYKPQPPSAALDIYRRGMREQMRRATRTGLNKPTVGRTWSLHKLIAECRDVPDQRHMHRMRDASDPYVWEHMPTVQRVRLNAQIAIARVCLALMAAYHAAVPSAAVMIAPHVDDFVRHKRSAFKGIARDKWRGQRAHYRNLRKVAGMPYTAPAEPRTAVVMHRTRPARVPDRGTCRAER